MSEELWGEVQDIESIEWIGDECFCDAHPGLHYHINGEGPND